MSGHAGLESSQIGMPLFVLRMQRWATHIFAHGLAKLVMGIDTLAARADLPSACDGVPRVGEPGFIWVCLRVELAHGCWILVNGEQVRLPEVSRRAEMPAESNFFFVAR